ncbi:MAG: hypothetical protein KAJ19_20640 [Gammaproteobacteria bacterium]|nr:hypothetical protein [Gammaproteobacteria bacterium]
MKTEVFLDQLEQALGTETKTATTTDIFIALCSLARQRHPPLQEGTAVEISREVMKGLIARARQLIRYGTDYYKPERGEKIPERVERGVCYLVGEPLAMIIFTCPCGCKDHIFLPAAEGDENRYLAGVDGDNEVAINPSIEWKGTCRSHFVISKSRVIWIF